MTSLVVWVAMDQRGPASVYIATDSRISWPAGPTGATQRDGARKTYSTTKLAHIMGYVGDVLFPALTLPTVAAQLDECPHDESVEVAQERVLELVTAAWRDAPSSARLESRLAHCTRVGAGIKARFGVQILHLPVGTTEWTATALELPPVSSTIDFLGSGRQQLENAYNNWVKPAGSERDRTSRVVFSAFCDAMDSGKDRFTGGAPQLVGLYRQGPGRIFGVHWNGQTYLCGTKISDIALSNFEYGAGRRSRRVGSGWGWSR